jgi:hypothetical protein
MIDEVVRALSLCLKRIKVVVVVRVETTVRRRHFIRRGASEATKATLEYVGTDRLLREPREHGRAYAHYKLVLRPSSLRNARWGRAVWVERNSIKSTFMVWVQDIHDSPRTRQYSR